MAKRKAVKALTLTDRIGAENPETGIREVTLPTVPGLKAADATALFEFERGILGTMRALIRMSKRSNGLDVPTPARIASAGIPKSLKAHYA